jgi:hypothetical protein
MGVLIIASSYTKNYVESTGEKKIEIFSMPLVEFQGVILRVAAFWVKRNTPLRTYKSGFTLYIFQHAYTIKSCWYFVTDLLNQRHVSTLVCVEINNTLKFFLCFP